MQRDLSEIKELDTEVIAITTVEDRDRRDVEKAINSLGITFHIISGPNRNIAEDFGVYHQEKKRAIATFVLDKDGMIHFKYISKGDEDRPSLFEND